MAWWSKSTHIFGISLLLAATSLHAQTPEPINPKIVLQTLPYGGVEVAAWTPDDRYLITAVSMSRTVLIWDAKSGIIVDRLIFPSESQGAQISARRLTEMAVSEDGKNVVIKGEAVFLDTQAAKDRRRELRYKLDLETREITLTSSAAVDAETGALDGVASVMTALEVVYERSVEMPAETALKLLPALPASHDGKRTLRRDLVIEESSKEPQSLFADRPVRFRDAALSPNGNMLAMIQAELQNIDADQAVQSVIDIFDIQTGKFSTPVRLKGNYSQLQWLTEDMFLATEKSQRVYPGYANAALEGPPPPGVIVDINSAAALGEIEPRCFMARDPDGKIYGAGLANCRLKTGNEYGLQRFDINTGKWTAFGKLKLKKGTTVQAITASPSGGTVAVSTFSKNGVSELVVLDAGSGEVVGIKPVPNGASFSKIDLPTDDMLVGSGDGNTGTWLIESDGWLDLPVGSFTPRMADSDGKTFAVAGEIDDVIARYDFDSENVLPPLDFGNLIAGGFIIDRPVFWALSGNEGLRFWNTKDWSILQTTYFFTDQGFLTVTPEGRYDTNLGADANQFRWLVADRPNQSLGAQTFMRDYFLPGLAERLTTCSYFEDCEIEFEPIKPIIELNRVLPKVTITDVKQGAAPDEAIISIEVTEGIDPSGPNGKTRSGVYNPRLFRNFRFAAHTPDKPFELQEEIVDWRNLNRMADDDDQPGDGKYHFTAQIALPSGVGTEKQIISAYAFNEDRVKSDTALFEYTRPAMQPFQPRAFVISIGIDAYDEKRLNLDYAAADAKLLGQQLADIPGYEMRRLVIAGEKGGKTRVTADAIAMALAMLAGFDRKKGLEMLTGFGIDGTALDFSTPDDLVIISFSGHGWAQPKGDFFFVPADGDWPDGAPEPNIGSLISSSELTMWLRMINAADIALIIDACHSGASVDSGKFKPGPMGDSGLGQLAYDKGIRILAATQADDVALENATLKHGLLSFALAADGEALSNPEAQTDIDGDGKISLTEWMFYPTWRLPALNDDKRVTSESNETGSAFSFPGRTIAPPKKVQSPSLFDFVEPSPVILKVISK